MIVSSNSACTNSNVLSFSFHDVHGHVMPISDNSKTPRLQPNPNLVIFCKHQDLPEQRLSHWISITSLGLLVPWGKGVHPGNVPQDQQFWHVWKAQYWFFGSVQDCPGLHPKPAFHTFSLFQCYRSPANTWGERGSSRLDKTFCL